LLFVVDESGIGTKCQQARQSRGWLLAPSNVMQDSPTVDISLIQRGGNGSSDNPSSVLFTWWLLLGLFPGLETVHHDLKERISAHGSVIERRSSQTILYEDIGTLLQQDLHGGNVHVLASQV
jgi:hypothetical protein